MLAPLQSTEVTSKLWVGRPGVYSLCGWSVETEVGQEHVTVGQEEWRTAYKYLQRPSAESVGSLVVSDSR
jgi:hypothetical protein